MIADISLLVAQCHQRNIDVNTHASVRHLTTYGVGGSVAALITVRTRDDIMACAHVLKEFPTVPVVVLGRGSNTLFNDGEFGGVVVLLASSDEAKNVDVEDSLLTASGAMLMPVLARRSVQAGRGGLEWCVGIPGTVGGAVRMNAGGHGAEIVDALDTCEIASLRSGTVRSVQASDLGLHFRGSALSPHHVVVTATFRTSGIRESDGSAELDSIVAWRRSNQPGGRNAGSVFVNPEPGEGSAGSLIDAAGLRGFSVGGAAVSDKHANFIQAGDTATAADIIGVMSHVQDVVKSVHGVVLRSEVRLVGFPHDVVSRFAETGHESREKLAAQDHLRELLGDSA